MENAVFETHGGVVAIFPVNTRLCGLFFAANNRETPPPLFRRQGRFYGKFQMLFLYIRLYIFARAQGLAAGVTARRGRPKEVPLGCVAPCNVGFQVVRDL